MLTIRLILLYAHKKTVGVNTASLEDDTVVLWA